MDRAELERTQILTQTKVIADFNARMTDACFDMCITNMRAKRMDVEEETCVDRCSYKYWETHKAISERMQAVGATKAAMTEMTGQSNNWANDPESRK